MPKAIQLRTKMISTAKIINIILYHQGQGGTFLTRLFSLSDNTQFLWKPNTCGCRPINHSIDEKLKYYSYTDKIKNWGYDAHNTAKGASLVHEYGSPWETNPIIITALHYTYVHSYKKIYPQVQVAEKIFCVKSSSELLAKLKNQVNMDNVITSASPDYHKINAEVIDMDLMMSDDDSMMGEYMRVCKLMMIVPVDSATILEFVHGWKTTRENYTESNTQRN